MAEVLTFYLILFHSLEPSYLNTGTRPSYRSLDLNLTKMYLILHVFDFKGDCRAFGETHYREMEPCTIIIFGMICANPDVKLEN